MRVTGVHERAMRHMHVARSYAAHLLPFAGRSAGLGNQPVLARCIRAAVLCALLLLLCALAAPAMSWAEDGASSAQASSSLAETSESSSAYDQELDGPGNVVNARQTADNSFLYDTSVYELVQADATMQGATVQIVGEVVGDAIRAEEDPGKIWITLEAIEDQYENSISVLVDESVTNLIDAYGGYNQKGTTLQVRGTFYLACPSHEGIIDIHAEMVTLVARGSETEDVFDIKKFIPGLALCAIGAALSLLYRFLRERER